MITPAKQHYRRTHSPVPLVDPATYRLSVSIEGEQPKLFSLKRKSLSLHHARSRISKTTYIPPPCALNPFLFHFVVAVIIIIIIIIIYFIFKMGG